jgi:hypothetical protein
MTPSINRVASLAAALGVVLVGVELASAQPTTALDSGESVYRAACAACHALDGRGAPQLTVGFDVPLPDFTDCRFNSRERAADWFATSHDGGP